MASHHSPQERSIRKQLQWLFMVFFVGFALQAGINLGQSVYRDQVDAEIQNARVHGKLGQELVAEIKQLEQSFFQISAQSHPAARRVLMSSVEKNFSNIDYLLDVLEHGGRFEQNLDLNLPGQSHMTYVWHFQPTHESPYHILRIDIQPKLAMIRQQFELMNQRMDAVHQMMSEQSGEALQELAKAQRQIKSSVTLFVRLLENTNRIYFQQQNYLHQLEQHVNEQKFIFEVWKYSIIALLLLFGIWVFMINSRHIRNMALDLSYEKNRALAATRSKSLFLANMSHEIRTPLNAITGFITLLKEMEQDPVKLKYIETISQSSDSLLGIINDILDFSKIESNRLELDEVDFDPRREFRSVADLFAAKCDEKAIELKVEIANTLPDSLHSDPLRIKQVILNLLSNAVKFTPEGRQIEFFIDYDAARSQLKVSVRDQGIGISEEHQTHIFEAFAQAESSTTREFGGTGLGLAISRLLVELLGGELKLESQLGQGSCFYFSIPVKCGEPLRKKENVLDTGLQLTDKILLVEDNKTNQLLMAAVLKKLGVSFDVANDGVEAVIAYQTHPNYALILMDENMPNLSGSDATRQIRSFEQEQQLARVPIIALTANAMKGDRERFIEVGMDEYLTKPLNIKALQEMIAQFGNHPAEGT